MESLTNLMQTCFGDKRKYTVRGLDGKDISDYQLPDLEKYITEQDTRREKGYLSVQQRKRLDLLKTLVERLNKPKSEE